MTVYLDTSSLVKLYVEEAGSPDVRALVVAADLVATSAVTFAETRAALARLRRGRFLTPARYAEAERRFVDDWPAFLRLDVTDDLARMAGDIAEQHGVRGFDSIHLAAFAQILERSSDDDVHFSSFDRQMVAAARKLD